MEPEDFWKEEELINTDQWRVRVFACPKCHSLVFSGDIEKHIEWHKEDNG